MTTWARYFSHLGSYNLCRPSDKQWCVQLQTSGGNFSETWPHEDEPDVSGLLPSEVLDVIEQRLRAAWISTGRDATIQRMEEWRKHAHEYDETWLLARIGELDEKRARYTSQLETVRSEAEAATGSAA